MSFSISYQCHLGPYRWSYHHNQKKNWFDFGIDPNRIIATAIFYFNSFLPVCQSESLDAHSCSGRSLPSVRSSARVISEERAVECLWDLSLCKLCTADGMIRFWNWAKQGRMSDLVFLYTTLFRPIRGQGEGKGEMSLSVLVLLLRDCTSINRGAELLKERWREVYVCLAVEFHQPYYRIADSPFKDVLGIKISNQICHHVVHV